MTKRYFNEKMMDYSVDALQELSRDMINTYEHSPRLFAELLIRFLFFERLTNDEDRIVHNKIVEILYDMGIFQEGKEVEIANLLLGLADIPDIYKEE